jgi:hypothetical protein
MMIRSRPYTNPHPSFQTIDRSILCITVVPLQDLSRYKAYYRSQRLCRPALVSLVLLTVETVYLYFSLPETRGYKSRSNATDDVLDEGEKVQGTAIKRESVEVRQARLNQLGRLHGLFLLFFSGVNSGF